MNLLSDRHKHATDIDELGLELMSTKHKTGIIVGRFDHWRGVTVKLNGKCAANALIDGRDGVIEQNLLMCCTTWAMKNMPLHFGS